MNTAFALSALRGILQALGGALVTQGVISAPALPGAVDSAMTWIGLTMSGASFAWSWYKSRKGA